MPFRIRNADGELSFDDLDQVKVALREGFAEPSDELSKDGAPWVKVSDYGPLRVAIAQATAAAAAPLSTRRWYRLAAVLAAAGVALALLPLPRWALIAVAAVGAMGLYAYLTVHSARQRKRR